MQIAEIRKIARGIVKVDELLARYTTYGVGGPADVFFEPADADDIASVITWASKNSVPCFILGGGSNLLVSDKGFRGIVIRMGKAMSYIRVDGERIIAGAGAVLAKVVSAAVDAGLTGLEGVTAVPGSVGGALVMNAGTQLGSVGDVVELVRVVTCNGELIDLTREEMDFAYRWSRLQSDKSKIAVEAVFHLKPGVKSEIVRTAERLKKKRSLSQPNGRSAGCMFKNPEGTQGAGWMIDHLGLKGMSVGDAIVSDKHANFILNTGKATASDIKALAEKVRDAVRAEFAVDLEYEVRIVGDW